MADDGPKQEELPLCDITDWAMVIYRDVIGQCEHCMGKQGMYNLNGTKYPLC